MKLYLSISLFMITLLSANELAWVDEQVKAIKPARPGIDNKMIDTIKSPFIFLEKNGYKKIVPKKVKKKRSTKKVQKKKVKKRSPSKLNLEMIINSSALINGQWYKVGDIIKGSKILKINKQSVYVIFDGKKSVLHIKAKKSNLKFKKK